MDWDWDWDWDTELGCFALMASYITESITMMCGFVCERECVCDTGNHATKDLGRTEMGVRARASELSGMEWWTRAECKMSRWIA